MSLERKHLFFICLSTLAIGLGGGFFISNALQNHIQVLAIGAIIFAFLTWMGSAADYLTLLRDWLNERRTTPKLSVAYDQANKDQFCPIVSDKRILGYDDVRRKYLRIQVKNSGGLAKNCDARLTITNSRGNKIPTTEEKYLQWVRETVTKIDIGMNDHLFLNVVFSIDKNVHNDTIAFVSTRHSISGPEPPRQNDGFRVGEYDFDIRLKPENGDPFNTTFRLDIKKNWEDITMMMIKTE